MNLESIVEDFYNVPNKLRKHKNQIKMNESNYCDNCGENPVEQEGQHCSIECHREFWADMDRDER